MVNGVDVREAPHVKVNRHTEKIVSKWGIDSSGHLAKPSGGGFGAITENGRRVTMWEARSYLCEDK